MYMPVMVDLKRVTVFGGDRGEGLQKTQKLALYADELLVVPEAEPTAPTIDLPAGAQSELKEKLLLPAPRSVPVHPVTAGRLTNGALRKLIRGRTWVVSDLVDRKVNERIARLAARERVLCTVVDTKDLSNVWFMGLVKTDHLTVAISSGGTIAFAVPKLRQVLQPIVERSETEAAVLAVLREELPKATRVATLGRVYDDPEFRRLVDAAAPHADLLAHARAIAKECP